VNSRKVAFARKCDIPIIGKCARPPNFGDLKICKKTGLEDARVIGR